MPEFFLGKLAVKLKVLLAAILLLGVILKLIPIVRYDFWLDEQFSFYFATHTDVVQQFIAPVDNRPPLYYLFVKVLASISTDKIFLRLPNIFFGVATSYVLFRFFVAKNQTVAWLLLFFSTFSLLLIENTWQLRDYSLLVFVTTLFILLLQKIYFSFVTHTEENWDFRAFLGLGLVGSLLSQIFFIEFAAGMLTLGLLLFFQRRKLQLKKVGLLLGLAILIASSSLFYIVKQFSYTQGSLAWIGESHPADYLRIVTNISGLTADFEDEVATSLRTLTISTGFMLTILLLAWLQISKSKNTELKVIYNFHLVWLLADLGLIWLAKVLLNQNIFISRYFSTFLIHFLLVMSISLTSIFKTFFKEKHKIWLTLFLIGYLGYFLFLYTKTYNPFPAPLAQKTVDKGWVNSDRESYYRQNLFLMETLTPLVQANTQIILFPLSRSELLLRYYFFEQYHRTDTNFFLLQRLINCEQQKQDCLYTDLPQINEDTQIIVVLENHLMTLDKEQQGRDTEILHSFNNSLCQKDLEFLASTGNYVLLRCLVRSPS